MAEKKSRKYLEQWIVSDENCCEDGCKDPDISSCVTNNESAIKKDFVKQQRRQFENSAVRTSSNVSPKSLHSIDEAAPSVRNSMAQKSRNRPVLKRDHVIDDSANVASALTADSSAREQVNFGKPGRKSLSVAMEKKLSTFEIATFSKDNSVDNPSKPTIPAKPDNLNFKLSVHRNSNPLEYAQCNETAPESIFSQSILFRNVTQVSQNESVLHDTSQRKELPSSSTDALRRKVICRGQNLELLKSPITLKSQNRKDSLDSCLTKLSSSPVTQSLNSRTEKSMDGNNLGVDRNSEAAESLVLRQKNSGLDNSENSSIKMIPVVTPPPKPPRLFLEQRSSQIQRPLQPQHTPSKGSYAHLTETASAVHLPEQKSEQRGTPASSATQNTSAVKSEAAKIIVSQFPDRTKIDQWWENKFIRAAQPTAPHDKGKLQTKRINNPCYMYAKTKRPDDVIFGRPLTRHLSDELLDSKPLLKKRINLLELRDNDGPIYHDPQNLISQKRKAVESVMFDKDGYAVPVVKRDVGLKKVDAYSGDVDTGQNAALSAMAKQEERSYIKSKVSNAYAILRLPLLPGEQCRRDEDGDFDIDLEEHKKLLRHVSSVKYRTNDAIVKYEKIKQSSTDRLFQYAMIIGLCENACGQYQPKTLFCFPKEMAKTETLTSRFCFPDANIIQLLTIYEGEMFSFILTDANGDRRYGLCKRYLPPGSGPRLPEALCVVSTIGDDGFYGHLLQAAKETRFLSMEAVEEMLQSAHAIPFPTPSHEVYLRTLGPNSKRRVLILKRMHDTRLHTMVDFSHLMRHLPVNTLIKVFAAVLLERKVIFVAKTPSTLSLCICALVTLLYPFKWPHTFVTILPSDLTDVIDAPTPYIIGLLSSAVADIGEFISELNEVLVVDLDTGSLLRSEGDENCIIPKKLQKALIAALADDVDCQSGVYGQRGRSSGDDTVAEAFLRLFLETCGHYTEYVCCQQNGDVIFQRELFVKAVQSRSIRLFLDWFTQTQMFAVFITGRLKESPERGYFEDQIIEYRQEMEETTSAIENMKAFGKKIADFFRGSGDKLKRTFQKAVYV